MAINLLSKRWLINYLLIVLVGIFTYIGNRYEVKTGYQPENTISSLKPQDIHTLTIQTADHSFILRKTGNQWRFENPVAWPANNITLERIVSIVNNQTESRLAADEIDLAGLGLQFPKAILTLNDTSVLFGTTNNIGERRYIMIGSTVFLLPDLHLHFLTQGISGLIDRRLLPRSIQLKSLKLAEMSLSKSSNGKWQNENVEVGEADRLNQLVNNWQTLDAGNIKTYNKNKIPLQKIIAGLEDGSNIEFYLMSIKPELVIARPDLGLQYHFGENKYYDLLSVTQQK